jgi:hypothetical protein
MEMYDVVKKLLGEINPIGETQTDNARFENLKATVKLVDGLLFDIDRVTCNKTRHEHSMKRAGEFASKFLEDIKDQ